MIPKIIHYCWFGGNEIPSFFQDYINSWHKHLPDYKFILWNELNFDISSAPHYVQKAYQYEKFAFVADYVRLWALYYYGGVYLDTDVLLHKSLDEFLNNGFFSSIEYHHDMVKSLKEEANLDDTGSRKKNVDHIKGIGIQSAIFGAEKKHSYIFDCLHYYDDFSLNKKDGSINEDIILPDILALCAEKYGFKYVEGEQHLQKDIHIYPQVYFTGVTHTSELTIATHCAHNSWRNKTLLQRISMATNESRIGRYIKSCSFLRGIREFVRKHVWFK